MNEVTSVRSRDWTCPLDPRPAVDHRLERQDEPSHLHPRRPDERDDGRENVRNPEPMEVERDEDAASALVAAADLEEVSVAGRPVDHKGP